MAANDLKLKLGTAIVWTDGGANDFDHGVSFADTDAYEGDSVDLGAAFHDSYAVYMTIDYGGTAHDAGAVFELVLFYSDDNTWTNQAVTGTAQQFHSGSEDEYAAKGQPGGALVCSNDSNANDEQCLGAISPLGRYIVPVVINRSGQTAGAAADFELKLVPLIRHPESA